MALVDDKITGSYSCFSFSCSSIAGVTNKVNMEVLINGQSVGANLSREDLCLCWDDNYDKNTAACGTCAKTAVMFSLRFEYKPCTCAEPQVTLLYGCSGCHGGVVQRTGPGVMRPETGLGFRRALGIYTDKVDKGEGTAEMRRKVNSYRAAMMDQIRAMGISTTAEYIIELQY